MDAAGRWLFIWLDGWNGTQRKRRGYGAQNLTKMIEARLKRSAAGNCGTRYCTLPALICVELLRYTLSILQYITFTFLYVYYKASRGHGLRTLPALFRASTAFCIAGYVRLAPSHVIFDIELAALFDLLL